VKQHRPLKSCLRNLPTARLKRFIQRLIQPSRVQPGIALVRDLVDEMEDNMVFRQIHLILRHECYVLGVGIQTFLQGLIRQPFGS
jgi:hypothetical protein